MQLIINYCMQLNLISPMSYIKMRIAAAYTHSHYDRSVTICLHIPSFSKAVPFKEENGNEEREMVVKLYKKYSNYH